MLLSFATFFAVTSSHAQRYAIRNQPHRPARYEARERDHPGRPDDRHVWRSEEWVRSGGRYVYRPGYWALPPQPGGTWVPGRWDPSPTWPGRYVWVAGHWNY